jgi:OHCU decarboxylase
VNLAEFNSLSDGRAREELFKVCGSREWARAMEDARPFESIEEAHEAAWECWSNLSHENRLEAFAAHPRIGERSESAWSKQEQSGVHGEDATKLLIEGSKYEERFKHVFLICATGKGATEILAALKKRMANSPEQEFEIACEEQAKIIRLRMEKLFK